MQEIDWKPEYSVGVKEIDAQHQTFVGIMNKVYDALTEPAPAKRIATLLVELQKYGEFHFATEEKYFKKFKYPETEEHTKVHKELLKKIDEFMNNKDDDIMVLGFNLLDFLEDWLINHLDAMDKRYTKWFNEHGLF